MVRFSQLVVEQRWIKEMDINPLLASPVSEDSDHQSIIALDARVVLHDLETKEEDLPRLAIRPYPHQYVKPWTMKDGQEVNVRPIRPEDEPLMVEFHQKLSEQSVYMRYFRALNLGQRVAHDRLTRICFIDYDREMALVAVRRYEDGRREIIGAGRLSKDYLDDEAEFALLISDDYQGQGLGGELLRRLIQWGRDERVKRVVAYMLPQNSAMRALCQKQGFTLRKEEDMLKAELDL